MEEQEAMCRPTDLALSTMLGRMILWRKCNSLSFCKLYISCIAFSKCVNLQQFGTFKRNCEHQDFTCTGPTQEQTNRNVGNFLREPFLANTRTGPGVLISSALNVKHGNALKGSFVNDLFVADSRPYTEGLVQKQSELVSLRPAPNVAQNYSTFKPALTRAFITVDPAASRQITAAITMIPGRPDIVHTKLTDVAPLIYPASRSSNDRSGHARACPKLSQSNSTSCCNPGTVVRDTMSCRIVS